MKDQIPNSLRQSDQGFTLIEVSIILAIIGILLIPFIRQYNIDAQQYRVNLTRAHIGVTEAALKKFAIKYGKYPRPAAPNGTSGIEEAIPTDECEPNIVTTCWGTGARDADSTGTNDEYYVGTIPYAAIGVTEEESADGFGRKLSYTVTANLTDDSHPFEESWGILRVENADHTALSGPADNRAHFVIISHGKDGKGAFSLSGVQVSPCGATTAARDNENCDNDDVFDDGTIFMNYTDPHTGEPRTERVLTKALGNTAAYWDDYYIFSATTSSDSWLPVANEADMSNRNPGAVRINTQTGDDSIRVEVNGTVRARKSDGSTTGLYTEHLCETDMGSDCVPTLGIGTDNAPIGTENPNDEYINCGAGRGMAGIGSGQEACGNPLQIANPESIRINCTAGQFPYGIAADGTILCRAP